MTMVLGSHASNFPTLTVVRLHSADTRKNAKAARKGGELNTMRGGVGHGVYKTAVTRNIQLSKRTHHESTIPHMKSK